MRRSTPLIAIACLAMCASHHSIPPTREQLELALPRMLASDRSTEALALIESYLALHPNDPQVLFDAARVSSLLCDARGAAVFAIRAVRAGWVDEKALEEHPDLARLRTHDAWVQVLAVRREVRPVRRDQDPSGSDATARRSLNEWLAMFDGGRYRIEENGELRLITASSVEPEGFRPTMAAIHQLSKVLSKEFFGSIQPDSVLLVIATEADASQFLSGPQEGGAYVHEARRLVARDTGSSLRHEYAHVLHYGHMQRLKQTHPIWIQEGLATLFEDWQLGSKGELIILANLRSNEVYDRVRQHKAMAWTDFFSLDNREFMSQAQWNYAQARSMMMYFASEKKLTEWYRLYTTSWAADPSGRRALEQCFGSPIGRIEAQWKEWVHDRGRQDATIEPGDGVMGTAISNVADGVRIDSVENPSPAQRAGIREGDVITDIAGAEIRSVGDYLLATANRRVGENLKVRFRRGSSYSIVEVNLASGHAITP